MSVYPLSIAIAKQLYDPSSYGKILFFYTAYRDVSAVYLYNNYNTVFQKAHYSQVLT